MGSRSNCRCQFLFAHAGRRVVPAGTRRRGWRVSGCRPRYYRIRSCHPLHHLRKAWTLTTTYSIALLPLCHIARCWQSSSLELFLEPIVKLDDLLGGLSFRLELLRRLPGRQRVAKSGALLDATGATASPCTAAPARASARRRVAPGGMAFKTTKAGLPASFTISAVVPIARKSRIPGRHGMRIRSAAFAAASEALSACGAVSIRARAAPPSFAAWRAAGAGQAARIRQRGFQLDACLSNRQRLLADRGRSRLRPVQLSRLRRQG